MLTKLALIQTLADDDFQVFRQVRAGLSHFSTDLDMAKGQLGMITSAMLALHPHIMHIVGFTEANHAATADDVIQSTKLVRGAIRNSSLGMPDLLADHRVRERAGDLLAETLVVLEGIHKLGTIMGSEDPFSDPAVLASAIRSGLLFAPDTAMDLPVRRQFKTGPVNGGCSILDQNGNPLPEKDRIKIISGSLGINLTPDKSSSLVTLNPDLTRYLDHHASFM